MNFKNKVFIVLFAIVVSMFVGLINYTTDRNNYNEAVQKIEKEHINGTETIELAVFENNDELNEILNRLKKNNKEIVNMEVDTYYKSTRVSVTITFKDKESE